MAVEIDLEDLILRTLAWQSFVASLDYLWILKDFGKPLIFGLCQMETLVLLNYVLRYIVLY